MYPVGVFHTDRLFFIYSMSYLKYLFFILKEYLFFKRKNELIKNPLLSSLLECIDMGGQLVGTWLDKGQKGRKMRLLHWARMPASAGVEGWDFSPGITWRVVFRI